MCVEKHFNYTQSKKGRKNSISECEISLYKRDKEIIYSGNFYHRISHKILNIGCDDMITNTIYMISINTTNGDITTNENIVIDNDTMARNIIKRNDFINVERITLYGLINGGRKPGFWGVKYKRATDEIFNILKEILQQEFEFIKNKTYDEPKINNLFDLIVDYNLFKNKIKFHDNVYFHILQNYPLKKWLKLNDYKFLPAVLDKHDIKTKFFIGQLSTQDHKNLNIKVLSYVCKLFGESYIDHIKMFDWLEICKVNVDIKQNHLLKNETEKKTIISIIQNSKKKENKLYDIVELIYNLLTVRTFLEEKGHVLKLRIKTSEDIIHLTEEWLLMKKEYTKGYCMIITFPDDFVLDIEKPIIVDDIIFTPKILKTETDFLMEGLKMKNCMGRHFKNGKIFVYISLSCTKDTVDLQFQQNKLVQAFSKANTPIDKILFDKPISVLSQRISLYGNLSLSLEKQDIL